MSVLLLVWCLLTALASDAGPPGPPADVAALRPPDVNPFAVGVDASGDALKLARAYERKHLSWSGAGRVHRGNHGIGTTRFARLTGDPDTLHATQKLRLWLVPGFGLAGVGLGVAAVGGLVFTTGVTLLVVELIACALTLGTSCGTDVSSAWILTGAVMMGGGAAGVVIGLVGVGVAAAAIAPRLRLVNWYAPEDVDARIAAYNHALERELGGSRSGRPRPRGGIELGLTAGGVGAIATF